MRRHIGFLVKGAMAYALAYLVSGGLAYQLLGEASTNYAGWSVAGAGDVDGDGWADLLVGTDGEDGGGDDAGAAYLVLGGGY